MCKNHEHTYIYMCVCIVLCIIRVCSSSTCSLWLGICLILSGMPIVIMKVGFLVAFPA
jgi:hypothetical protein